MAKKIIIGIVVIALLFFAGAAYYVYRTSTMPDESSVGASSTTPRSFFGLFGDAAPRTDTFDGATTTDTSDAEEGEGGAASVRLSKVTDEPVAGAIFIPASSSTLEMLRYVEKETGHVFDVSAENGEIARRSNTTIPRIQTAALNPGGSMVLQYLGDDLETVEAYVARVVADADAQFASLQGFFLPKNIVGFALSPDGQNIFYLTRTSSGSEGFITSAAAGGGELRRVFSSPLSEWAAGWSRGGIDLFTKPSNGILGTSYRLDPASGRLRTLFPGGRGFTTISNPSGDMLLFAQNGIGEFGLFELSDESSYELSLFTLPEKCAWRDDRFAYCGVPETLSSVPLPDAWYQGRVSFSDSVWEVDALSGATTLLFSPADLGGGPQFDVVALTLNTDGTLLAFINRRDNSLWLAKIDIGG